MRRGKSQAGCRLVVRSPRLDARRFERGKDLLEERMESLARRRQLGRVRTAVDEVDADPFLERPDVAAERRLRDGARLGGAREVAAVGQRQEVFQPFHVEGSVTGAHGFRRG